MKSFCALLLQAWILTLSFGPGTVALGAPMTVPGAADPWLAGMPDGSMASNGDVAPEESSVLAAGSTLIPGSSLAFQVSGGVHFAPGNPSPPDGLSAVNHTAGAQKQTP